MATTAKGYPYPAATDANDVPADLQALAQKNDDRPGVSPLTTAARDALAGADLWDGRVIYNLTASRLERYNAAVPAWQSAGISDHGDLTGLADDDHPQYLLKTDNLLALTDKAAARENLGANAAYVAKAAFPSTGATPPADFPNGTSTSFWDVNTTGSPASAFSYTVLTVRASATSVVQYATERDSSPEGDESTFYRTGYSGGTSEWGAWQRLRSGADYVAFSIATAETTTSTTYGNLATAGPDTGTVVVGPSGRARIVIAGEIENNTAGQSGYISAMVATGPTAVGPADSRSLKFTSAAVGAALQASREVVFSGLTPGAYNFRLQYRVTGGTGTFRSRQIIAESL
jgi:hypothetical protein